MIHTDSNLDLEGAVICIAGQRVYELVKQASKSIDKAEITTLMREANDWSNLIDKYILAAESRWDVQYDDEENY